MHASMALFSRRHLTLVIVTGIFLGALFIASSRLDSVCPDGHFCFRRDPAPFGTTPAKRPKTDASPVRLGGPDKSTHPTGIPPAWDHSRPNKGGFNPAKKPGTNEPEKPGQEGSDEEKSQKQIPGDKQLEKIPGSGVPTVPEKLDAKPEGRPEAKPQPPASDNNLGEKKPDQLHKGKVSDPSCADFPDTSRVLVVMKTGASEAYGKVPTQVMTNLRCVPEYLIFSDKAQVIAGQTVFDSLDTVLTNVSKSNDDFKLYWRQQDCPLDVDQCNKHADAASEGWALDKYKNVHIAEKTFAMKPGYDWYLFTDADTYVVWPTMMQWLDTLNATERHYLGSVAMLGDFPFGHGGSGYLVSKPAMKAMFEGKQNVANQYDVGASETCCGDYMFAYALKHETSVEVQNMWPTINGEKPSTLEFDSEQWCQPITTMHHIGAEEVTEFDAFEQERKYAHPMRIRDIFHQFVEPHLGESRDDWNNGSEDEYLLDAGSSDFADWELEKAKKEELSELERKAHLSFDDCKAACFSREDCMQFAYHNRICQIGKKIKHGNPTKKEAPGDERWRYRSGWNVERIKQWVQSEECGSIEYPSP